MYLQETTIVIYASFSLVSGIGFPIPPRRPFDSWGRKDGPLASELGFVGSPPRDPDYKSKMTPIVGGV